MLSTTYCIHVTRSVSDEGGTSGEAERSNYLPGIYVDNNASMTASPSLGVSDLSVP